MNCSSPSLIGENCRFRSAGYCLGSFVGLVAVVIRLLIGAPIVTAGIRSPQPLSWCNWLIWLIWFIWLVLFDQKTRQTKQTRQTRETYSSSLGCLLLDRRLITTKVRMVKPKSQRLGRP